MVLVASCMPTWAMGAGMYLTTAETQLAPVEDKAVMYFDGKKEKLVISQTFNTNPLTVWKFGWMIAVPSKPLKIEALKTDVFTNMATASASPKPFWGQQLMFPEIQIQSVQPAQVHSRAIDMNKPTVFAPDQMEQFLDWTRMYGYILPKGAKPVLENYMKQGWYVITFEVNALHLEYSATDSLTLRGAHTLPVTITFETQKLVYPMRLAAVGEDVDSLGVPLSFQYGQNSEQVLGVSDKRVDELLATQSQRKYPALPTDFVYLKTELFVIADRRYTAQDFLTSYADWTTLEGSRQFMTHLVGYKPLIQEEDIILTPVANGRVNAHVTAFEIGVRIGGYIIGIGGIIAIWRFKKHKH